MVLSVIFLLVLIFAIHKYLARSDSESDKNFYKIPGPKGIPLFGNVQDCFYSGEKIWRVMRERALRFYPIYKLKILNDRMVHLIDPKDVEVILKDVRYMSKGPIYDPIKLWIGNGILVSEGEFWRKGRKLLTKCFHFGALPKYMQSFNEEVEHLVKSLDLGVEKPSDLNQHINKQTFNVALDTLVGKLNLPNGTNDNYLKALKTLTRITGIKLLMPGMNFFYRFTKLKKEEDNALVIYKDLISKIIGRELILRDNGIDQKKLLHVLLENFDSKSRNDEMSTFIFAGQDTTATAMIFILHVLANKQHFQEEIYKEIMQLSQTDTPTYGQINQMTFLDRFIKECLRMYPPAYFIGRYSKEDISLPSGYTIPAGTPIYIDIYDIHHNPNIYKDPEKFDPDRVLPENSRNRHPFSFLPFSAGPRNCIAQKFAILEIKTTICGILKKFRVNPVGGLEDMVFVPDILLQTKSPIKVIFRSRSE